MNRSRLVAILFLLVVALLCAVVLWLAVVGVPARPVAAQPALALALIPGRGGQWLYVEAPTDAVVSCVGCALGPAQVNGTVRTYTLRALEPGWQVTTTTTDGRAVTLTHGAVVWFPWVGR